MPSSFSYKYYVLFGLALTLAIAVTVMFIFKKPESYMLKNSPENTVTDQRNNPIASQNVPWNDQPLFWSWNTIGEGEEPCVCRHCKKDYHQQCGL